MTSSQRGTTSASIQVAASSLVMTRVVVASSAIGDSLEGPDNSHSVIFCCSKCKNDDVLEGFNSDCDDDEEQKP